MYIPYSQYVKRYSLTHGLSDQEQRNLLWGNGGRQLKIIFERQTGEEMELFRRKAIIRWIIGSIVLLLFVFLGFR